MPPSTICIVAGSRAICPEQKMKPLALMACEYGPMACGAPLVATGSRVGMGFSPWRIEIGFSHKAFSTQQSAFSRQFPYKIKRYSDSEGTETGSLGMRNTRPFATEC